MDDQTENYSSSIHDESDRLSLEATSWDQEATSECSDQPILQEEPELAKDSESRRDELDPGGAEQDTLLADNPVDALATAPRERMARPVEDSANTCNTDPAEAIGPHTRGPAEDISRTQLEDGDTSDDGTLSVEQVTVDKPMVPTDELRGNRSGRSGLTASRIRHIKEQMDLHLKETARPQERGKVAKRSAVKSFNALSTALAGLQETGDYDRDQAESLEVYRRFWGFDPQEGKASSFDIAIEWEYANTGRFHLALQAFGELEAAEIEMRGTIASNRGRAERAEARCRQLEEQLQQERGLRLQLEEAAEKDRDDSKSMRKRLKEAEQALVEVRKTGAESLVRVERLEKALRDAEAPAAQAGIELSRTQKGTASRLVRISEPEDVPARGPTALDSQESSNKVDKLTRQLESEWSNEVDKLKRQLESEVSNKVDKLKRQLESEVNSHKLAQSTLRQAERHLKSSQTAEETLRIDNKRLRDEIKVLETTGLSSHISLAKHMTASHELAALRRLLLQERRAVKSVQTGRIDGRLGSIEAADDGVRSRDGHSSAADRGDRIKGGRRSAVEKASLKRKYNELKADRNKWRDLFDGLQHTFEGK